MRSTGTDEAVSADRGQAIATNARHGAAQRMLLRAARPVNLKSNFVWVLLALFVVAATLVEPVFLSTTNFFNIIVASVSIGLLALGQSAVLMLGKIDLSTESNMVFVAVLSGFLLLPSPTGSLAASAAAGLGWPWPPVVLVMLVVGLAVGLVNGVLVGLLRMNAFMVTLATSLALTGLAIDLSNGRSVFTLPSGFLYLGSGKLGSIPVSALVLLFVFLLAHLTLTRTRIGRHLRAVGSNRTAARVSGIPDVRIVIGAYGFSGLMAGLAAFLLVGQLGTAAADISSGQLFVSIAGAVIGGVSLFGGRGTVPGILGGVLLMGSVADSLDLAAVSSNLVDIVTAGIILVVIGMDAYQHRRSEV